ncbi:MAG TPA: hypothetical protein VG944_11465 [Fimbriimonas sp.]|nr:hypothetical protein [Fimbriimonas sp.]
MGLERRGNGFAYYRKRRIGDRVVSEYAGCGQMALIIHKMDQLDREQAKLNKQQQTAGDEEEIADELQLIEYCESVGQAISSVIEESGYHRQNRGPWRRRKVTSIV